MQSLILILLLLLASAANAQKLTSPSGVAVVGPAATGNFSETATVGSPDIFGMNHYQSVNYGTLGSNLFRNDMQDGPDSINNPVVPSSTTTAYDAALASNCPTSSICDPSTWNWSADVTLNQLIAAHAAGGRTMGIVSWVNPLWNSWSGTNNGVPKDWNVYEDVVMKFVAHFTPNLMELWNEPDISINLSGQSTYATNQAAYEDIYFHAAHAIRNGNASQGIAANTTLPLGGPVNCCADPNVWFTPLWNDARFGANHSWVNFFSYHGYTNSGPATDSGTVVASFLNGLGAKIPFYVTEWNSGLNAPCDTYTTDDPASVGLWGDLIISMMNAGATGANYFENENTSFNAACALMDSNNNLYPKTRVFTLMFTDMGLGAGAFQYVPTTVTSAITVGQGAINSSGKPVMMVANFTGSALNTVVTFSGLSISGSHTVSVYLVDFGSNAGASPISTSTPTISGGTYSQAISMTANSVAGVIIN